MNRQGIPGQGIRFYFVYVILKSVGKGQDQRDADDPDTSRKSGQEGAPFLRKEVANGKGKCRKMTPMVRSSRKIWRSTLMWIRLNFMIVRIG